MLSLYSCIDRANVISIEKFRFSTLNNRARVSMSTNPPNQRMSTRIIEAKRKIATITFFRACMTQLVFKLVSQNTGGLFSASNWEWLQQMNFWSIDTSNMVLPDRRSVTNFRQSCVRFTTSRTHLSIV